MNIFEILSDVKKASLMLEKIHKGMTKVNEIYKQFQPAVLSATDVDELTNAVNDYKTALVNAIPHDVYNNWEAEDYTVYTDEFHGRSYWNKIPNHHSIEEIIEAFLALFDVQQEPTEYILSLYDFNDYNIPFANEDDLNSFICNYYVVPYTVFKKVNGVMVEQYSE